MNKCKLETKKIVVPLKEWQDKKFSREDNEFSFVHVEIEMSIGHPIWDLRKAVGEPRLEFKREIRAR